MGKDCAESTEPMESGVLSYCYSVSSCLKYPSHSLACSLCIGIFQLWLHTMYRCSREYLESILQKVAYLLDNLKMSHNGGRCLLPVSYNIVSVYFTSKNIAESKCQDSGRISMYLSLVIHHTVSCWVLTFAFWGRDYVSPLSSRLGELIIFCIITFLEMCKEIFACKKQLEVYHYNKIFVYCLKNW